MKISFKWLQDYVNIALPPEELAHLLTMSGTETECVNNAGSNWDGVSVAQVKALDKHPDADRLLLATVDLGKESITIVTGAPNLEVGQKVPFAKVGTQLIDGYTGKVGKLKPAKIRGVKSEGMVCSEKELGISDNHEGIMVLPSDAPVGTPLADYLGDTILDLTTTANRPDCLSVIGIAREVAALTDQEVHIPEIVYNEPGALIDDQISIEILDPELCPRYCASLVTDVKVGPSPAWMQQRLLAGGMRPINNIVDITNYVMLEYGQPLHAFDYTEIKGKKIIVRSARDDESIFTLDGQERKLDQDMLIIADEKEPIAIAGVMGGAESEVIETTTTILLESANFNAGSIRRTSTRLGLRSEASSRFEKNINPELPPIGLRRATQLFVELAGAKAAKGIADAYPGKKEKPTILLQKDRVRRVLGVDLNTEKVIAVLSSLGFTCDKAGSSGDISVTIPYWRTDIRLPDDVIEEVARIIGYDDIPTTMLRGEIPAHAPTPLLDLKALVSDFLVGCGMQETINYSLVSRTALSKIDPQGQLPNAMRAANPMSSEQEYMRTSLRSGLLSTFSANEKHEQTGIKLFEVGRIYLPQQNDLPEEREVLVGIIGGLRRESSWLSKDNVLDFFDAKGILEILLTRLQLTAEYKQTEDQILLPGRTAQVIIDKQEVGTIGEVHPKIATTFDISSQPVILFEIDLKKILTLIGETIIYKPIPRFPEIYRDLALVVDIGIDAGKVQDIIQSSPLVSQVSVFDVYTGKQVPQGKKSLAFSVRYQSPQRTLTDEEVDKTQNKLIKRLEHELGATLRS